MELHKMSNEEYELSYNNALNLYKNLTKSCEVLNVYENDIHPMHPSVFYRLSNVINFNKQNGKNYNEYIELWKKRK